ncbi:MlaD family protein [Pseudomonas sp. HR96]|uniref:PqiB family protein n=1 Tax=Pseudomonas sp. HR96 TaxID=1027966 RepID=UPI002A74AC94|nr:MlaD family protein [Pseudomonas sp. HR96]WPO97761.1 MlaD family protein [Pseudomonas sp. HR96]
MTDSPNSPPAPGNPEIRRRRLNVSLVWLVPIVAALIGLSMVVHNALSAGPAVLVSFQTAEGLEAGKTQVKYKNVVIGMVTAIALSDDRSHVEVSLQLNQSAKSFTAQDSRFWVVRPRIGAGGISGIDTLLSGAFIGADAGSSQTLEKNFVGLETPPPVTYGQRGRRYTLHTDDLGSLDIGSAVYYRRIPVGQVVSYHLSKDGKGVDLDVFINSPNDQFVTTDTRFWNASGVDISLGANGLKVNTESVSSIISGGIAFVEPKYSPNPVEATEGNEFTLFSDQEAAMAPPDGPPHYIRMRFDQATRGLAINAPVEFLGVNIGRVVSVDLDYDEKTQVFPTMIGAVIYPSRLGKVHEKLVKQTGDEDDAKSAALLGQFVAHGLRAQVRNANILTGQLYISLTFVPDAKPVKFDLAARPLEIPTVPGSLDKLQEQLQAFVDKVSKLPIDQIAANLNGNLSELQKTLKQVNGDVLPQMRDTLVQTRKTLASANDTFAEDSPQRQQLSQAMDEVQRTARSVRTLTDFLGRHPEALIRGRLKDSQPDAYRSTINTSREPAQD